MPTAQEVERLWAFARLLVNENQLHQAVVCLELCVSVPTDSAIALRASILLAECCLSLCQTEPKKRNRELWSKRYERAQQLIALSSRVTSGAEKSEQVGGEQPRSWGARWHKCKYLIVKWMKAAEASIKNRQTLQALCAGIQWCYNGSSVNNRNEWSVIQTTAKYLLTELRATLVGIHSRAMYPQLQGPSLVSNQLAAFEEDLKFVRTSMPSKVDSSFQFWLIEVSCHLLALSPRYASISDTKNALAFADRWVAARAPKCSVLKMYHQLIKCFFMQRCGEIKSMGPVVKELKSIAEEVQNDPARSVSRPIYSSMVDMLELEVTSRYDPSQAVADSMKAIHRVQEHLESVETNPSSYILMLGLLFDMLFIHCELHRQQARLHEMGVSISQLLKLFGAYKHLMDPTDMLAYYTAQVHVTIAKYAYAIGQHGEGEVHLKFVLKHLLPPIRENENAYPLWCLRVWNSMLDAAIYCGGTDPHPVGANSPRVKQLYPTVNQLNLASAILQTANLRAAMNACGNVELRARYQLSLSKWLWATNELTLLHSSSIDRLDRPEALERFRLDALTMLHEALELVSSHVNCTEATAEIMALFGSELLRSGQLDNAEETLKSAIRLSLHAKNVVLQTRLLVDVFRLYEQREVTQAKTMTADKYEKKMSQLQRRVAHAVADQGANSAILSWSSSS